MVDGDRLLTSGEAARFLGVSLPTLVKWVRSGEIDAIRYSSKKMVFRRSELLRFQASKSTRKISTDEVDGGAGVPVPDVSATAGSVPGGCAGGRRRG